MGNFKSVTTIFITFLNNQYELEQIPVKGHHDWEIKKL